MRSDGEYSAVSEEADDLWEKAAKAVSRTDAERHIESLKKLLEKHRRSLKSVDLTEQAIVTLLDSKS